MSKKSSNRKQKQPKKRSSLGLLVKGIWKLILIDLLATVAAIVIFYLAFTLQLPDLAHAKPEQLQEAATMALGLAIVAYFAAFILRRKFLPAKTNKSALQHTAEGAKVVNIHHYHYHGNRQRRFRNAA